MPRNARNLLGNILIHNMVQGINKEYIFKGDVEKKKYIELIKKYSKEFSIIMVSYCIMDNHAHLLTYSENINKLSLFMKQVNGHYARFYNKINNRVGYVFRNRFCSKPILSEKQLYQCIKYIHLNPVKANITKCESDYVFSSYRDYIDEKNFKLTDIFNNILNSDKNYIEKLKSTEYKDLKIDNEKVNLKEQLKIFSVENKILYKNCKKDIVIKKFVSYLIANEYDFTKVELAKLFNISRSKLYKILES